MKRLLHIIMMSYFLCSCGEGGIFTQLDTSTGATSGTREFSLASDFPAQLTIPDIEGMRSTAFIVSVSDPAGLLAIDLESSDLQLSSIFAGCTLPSGTGLPAGPIVIASPERAYLLTSSHLIACNPQSGSILSTLNLQTAISLPQPMPLSRPYDVDSNGTLDYAIQHFTPSYPGGLTLQHGILYVSFSNYLLPIGDPVAAPGIVRQFYVHDDAPHLSASGQAPIVTQAYNPTALRTLPDGRIVIVNSGVNTIRNAATLPITTSGIELYDPRTRSHEWFPIGAVALSFQAPALSNDGRHLWVSSAAFNTLYSIDLDTRRVTRSINNPIILGNDSVMHSDYVSSLALTDDQLFAGSFAQSTVYALPITNNAVSDDGENRQSWQVGFATGVSAENPSGGNTGIGGIALRPGTPGIDFTGDDLYVLTANPGKLIGINTQRAHSLNLPPPTEESATGDTEQEIAEEPDEENTDEAITEPLAAPDGPINPLPNSNIIFAESVFDFEPGAGAGTEGGDDQWAHYPDNILGPPQGGVSAYEPAFTGDAIFSIGCHGSITLDMGNFVIADGPGDDFIVFENAFYFPKPSGTNVFSEPAEVSVSLDGMHFTAFPCAEEAPFTGCAGTQPTLTSSSNTIDPSNPHLAGGNAFDLADVELTHARYVRIRDLGCVMGGSFELDAISTVWGEFVNE